MEAVVVLIHALRYLLCGGFSLGRRRNWQQHGDPKQQKEAACAY
jgi:hypothetical protein